MNSILILIVGQWGQSVLNKKCTYTEHVTNILNEITYIKIITNHSNSHHTKINNFVKITK